VNGSLPVDLLMEEVITGGALMPNTIKYISITSVLRDRGLALAWRQTASVLVPSCLLSKPEMDRRIELCKLVFGTEPAASEPAIPPISSGHTATTPIAPTVSALTSSPRQGGGAEVGLESASSIPPAVSPGYQSTAVVAGESDGDGGSAVDFPPADLPADCSEVFRIVITHVDDDCHIYGHALREGTELKSS